MSVWKSLAVALPKLKQMATAMGENTAIRLPYTSLSGAHSKGPRPNPIRNSEVPRIAVCDPTSKWRATWAVPAE